MSVTLEPGASGAVVEYDVAAIESGLPPARRGAGDVPGDLTVCGFDDTTLSTTIWPELTTVHQPIADMSRAALELLLSEIRGARGLDPSLRHRWLDYTLIRRQSDAAPRQRPRHHRA